MHNIVQKLHETEKVISALKKAIAEKESLLPGLRLAEGLERKPDPVTINDNNRL